MDDGLHINKNHSSMAVVFIFILCQVRHKSQISWEGVKVTQTDC